MSRQPESSAENVARWMLGEIERDGELAQYDAALEIESRFGENFIYENENGNLAIDRKVLAAFRKLTVDSVVWDRGEKRWYLREPPRATSQGGCGIDALGWRGLPVSLPETYAVCV